MGAEPTSSRRSLLRAGLAGLAGLALGALGRPSAASAAAGGSIVMGAANDAAGTNTSLSTSTTGTALQVTQNGTGTALRGVAGSGIAGFFTSAGGSGVSGVVGSNSKYGVYGGNDAATYGGGAAMRASGQHNYGLIATTENANAVAVKADNTYAGYATAIRAMASNGTTSFITHWSVSDGAIEAVGAIGVLGTTSNGYNGIGIYGASHATNGIGVEGRVDSTGAPVAVYGLAENDGFGIYSAGDAHVLGDLGVTGALSKASGSFKIDHPLDPANKYLYHSFVESPDMKNVYDGVVTLDAKGEATIELPDWFEALNRDFRYQLTPIGPAEKPLYVRSKLTAGRFAIAGGHPGQEISWQVTGIRKDAWAEAHRVPVEELKPEGERGLYLHPVEHGRPKAKGIEETRIAKYR